MFHIRGMAMRRKRASSVEQEERPSKGKFWQHLHGRIHHKAAENTKLRRICKRIKNAVTSVAKQEPASGRKAARKPGVLQPVKRIWNYTAGKAKSACIRVRRKRLGTSCSLSRPDAAETDEAFCKSKPYTLPEKSPRDTLMMAESSNTSLPATITAENGGHIIQHAPSHGFPLNSTKASSVVDHSFEPLRHVPSRQPEPKERPSPATISNQVPKPLRATHSSPSSSSSLSYDQIIVTDSNRADYERIMKLFLRTQPTRNPIPVSWRRANARAYSFRGPSSPYRAVVTSPVPSRAKHQATKAFATEPRTSPSPGSAAESRNAQSTSTLRDIAARPVGSVFEPRRGGGELANERACVEDLYKKVSLRQWASLPLRSVPPLSDSLKQDTIRSFHLSRSLIVRGLTLGDDG